MRLTLPQCWTAISRAADTGRIDLITGLALVGYADDPRKTAVCPPRQGCDVTYVTNLGTKVVSDRLGGVMRAKGVTARPVGRHQAQLPGINAIETEPKGARSYRYWRNTPAGVACTRIQLGWLDPDIRNRFARQSQREVSIWHFC